MSEGENRIRMEDVQQQFMVYSHQLLKNANDNKEPLDPKVFDTIARFMEKSKIVESEGPALSPEFLEAARQAKNLMKKSKEG